MATRMNGPQQHVGAGVLAGIVGGLAGTVAMNEVQALWSKATDGFQSTSAAGRHDSRDWQEKNEDDNANEVMAQTIATHTIDRELTEDELKIAAPVVHFSFGSALGAMYGGMMEAVARRRRDVYGRRASDIDTGVASGILAGAAFGTAVWIGADEIAMPTLGLSSDRDYPLEAHVQSFVAHLAYGITAEFVRRGVRALLARNPGGYVRA
jgi:hypothetical protein